jgi:2-polyprenyl-3-methyl-5-hydroxy-6-metoxy-1,4-benzoquinol methylase
MASIGQHEMGGASTAMAAISPAHFFETVMAFQHSVALKAAIELDVFTVIGDLEAAGEGDATSAAVAARAGAAERGIRILCDTLVVMGFLTKHEQHYALTPDAAALLNRHSPAFLGGSTEFLLSPRLMEGYLHLADAVRKGGTTMPGEGTLSAENPIWVQFARAMGPMMRLPAQQLATQVDPAASEPLKVLDIAAGHGFYGIAFAERNPQAEVTALDWAPVLEVAQENARAAGVVGRFHTIAGSAFEVAYSTDYDVVLLPNFLHHFDLPTNEDLLRRVHAALRDGGRAAILDWVVNEDRVSPPIAAQFALTMLTTTPHGDVYTFAELDRMTRNAGFQRSEIHALPPLDDSIMLAWK